MNILKSEVFKMFHKKEIYIFTFLLIGCAILFSYLMGTNSNILEIQGLNELGGGFFAVFVYS